MLQKQSEASHTFLWHFYKFKRQFYCISLFQSVLTSRMNSYELEYTPIKAWLSQLVNFKNSIWTWGHIRRTICYKFCFKLEKTATETYGMLQTAFRPFYMNRASVFVWHKRFKEGKESVRDDERCGRSKEVNTPQLIGQRVRVRVTMLMF